MHLFDLKLYRISRSSAEILFVSLTRIHKTLNIFSQLVYPVKDFAKHSSNNTHSNYDHFRFQIKHSNTLTWRYYKSVIFFLVSCLRYQYFFIFFYTKEIRKKFNIGGLTVYSPIKTDNSMGYFSCFSLDLTAFIYSHWKTIYIDFN
jgi:hypothetical protein